MIGPLVAAAALCAQTVEPGADIAMKTTCLERAAAYADIEVELIIAIAYVESGWRLDAVNGANTNRTEDVCAMQINSIHFERLAKAGITRKRLMTDHCACLFAGAHIMAEMTEIVGKSWDAVAAYNAGPGNIEGGQRYAAKVRLAYEAIKELRSRPSKNKAD